MKSVYFLVRAHNDFDCRLPLMLNFSKDSNYCVKVIIYPTNNGIYYVNSHNLYNYAQDHGITINTIYDLNNYLVLKILSRVYYFLGNSRRKNYLFILYIRVYLVKIIFRFINFLCRNNPFFCKKIFSGFKGSIVIIDEIIFSENRSFFVDQLRDYWKRNLNFFLCSFTTGQDIFLNLKNPLHNSSDALGEELDIPLFVPGPNDKKLWQSRYPKLKIDIVGNTRFDSAWIQVLNEMNNDVLGDLFLKNEFENKTIKIVFMLSKIEYGINNEELINSINSCSLINNAIVILKPHTRGMKLADLGYEVNDKVIDGSKYSSSDLIKWANFVTFTGSSIVFHAILSNKIVIYLKYCHIFKTIFDSADKNLIANSLEELLFFIKNYKDPLSYDRQFISKHIHNNCLSGLICENIKNNVDSKSVIFYNK